MYCTLAVLNNSTLLHIIIFYLKKFLFKLSNKNGSSAIALQKFRFIVGGKQESGMKDTVQNKL